MDQELCWALLSFAEHRLGIGSDPLLPTVQLQHDPIFHAGKLKHYPCFTKLWVVYFMSQVWILLVVVWYQALEAKRQLRMEETLEVLQHFGENKRLLLRLLMQRPCSRQQYIKKHVAGQYPLHFAPAWFMAKHASQTWGCDQWDHNKHSFDTNAAASERHNLKGKASKPRPPSYTMFFVMRF